jgi:hypothetical protein
MNYSEPGRKGRHVALWQSLFQSATIIGGAINLGLNINGSTAGGLSPKTYLVFVALTCTAPLVAFFVTPPKKVQRVDGLAVPAFPSEGFFKEIWLTLRELRDPRILACGYSISMELDKADDQLLSSGRSACSSLATSQPTLPSVSEAYDFIFDYLLTFRLLRPS